MDTEMAKAIAAQLKMPHGEQGLQVGEKMNEGNAYINHNTIDALQLQAGDRVLEIGMGNGHFVPRLFAKEPTITYMGCDFSELMVAEATQRNASLVQAAKATFHVTDATQLPCEDATMDHVFTVNTLYFWDDPVAVLTELKRVLKPGGQLLIAIRPKAQMLLLPFVQYGFKPYAPEELSKLLGDNGFLNTTLTELDEPEQNFFGQMVQVTTVLGSAVRP